MSAEEFQRLIAKEPDRVLMITARDLKSILEETASNASRQTADYLQKETMISRAEAKKYLNVSNVTFTHWENKGILKARSMVGNKYMYSLDEVKMLAGYRNARSVGTAHK